MVKFCMNFMKIKSFDDYWKREIFVSNYFDNSNINNNKMFSLRLSLQII